MRFGTNNINYFKFLIFNFFNFFFFVEKNADSLSGINVGVRCEKRRVGPKASRPTNIVISTMLNTPVKESIWDRVQCKM